MKQLLSNTCDSYPWMTSDKVSFRGFFFYDGSLYSGKGAIIFLEKISSINKLNEIIENLDGLYAFILTISDASIFVVDRARSMPLYFSVDGMCVSHSCKQVREYLKIEKDDVVETDLVRLLVERIVPENRTVYQRIKQVDLGQMVIIRQNEIDFKYYYQHYNPIKIADKSFAMSKLSQVCSSVFDRTVKAIDGRPVLLSLSGGYDSRFIACMLKEKGVEDVLCYTYGKIESFEVVQSKKVAETLDFRWVFVEHKDDIVDILSDLEYIEFCNDHDHTYYYQNVYAVKMLEKKGLIKKNSVVLTGLCGDNPTGYYIKESSFYNTNTFDRSFVINYLYSQNYNRYQLSPIVESTIKSEIEKRVDDAPIGVGGYENFIHIFDIVTTGWSHARDFLMMNKVHSYYGYEWLMPCWDREFLDFWYSLTPALRINQSLYEDWLMTELFNKYSLDTRKIIFKKSEKKLQIFLRQSAVSLWVRFLYPLGFPIKRGSDFNNKAMLETIVYKKVKNRKLIYHKSPGLANMLNIFIAEKRYGVKTVRKICKVLKPK